MLRVGITGGIGSGKSTVARIFQVLGIPVYDADSASKRLMTEDEELKRQITGSFGEEAYTDGILNRKYLAETVFANIEKLKLLNSFVHPASIQNAEEWMKKQISPYVIKEAALIFESGSQKQLDFVIGVKAPFSLRLQRAKERDQAPAEQVKGRMKMQMDEDTKMDLCDFIIENDEQHLLIPQVLKLNRDFLEIAMVRNR